MVKKKNDWIYMTHINEKTCDLRIINKKYGGSKYGEFFWWIKMKGKDILEEFVCTYCGCRNWSEW